MMREFLKNVELERIKDNPDISGYDKKVAELVSQYKKPVILVDVEDVPENIPLREKDEVDKALWEGASFDFGRGNFNRAKEKIREYLSLYAIR